MIDLAQTFRALRHRQFRRFFIGQTLSNVGTWLQQVAMGWLTYRVSGSVWLLGLVAFCANIGILVLSPIGGVLADRINGRRGLLVTQTLMMLQAIVLAVVTALGIVQVWHLVVLALWLGITWAFDVPFRQALYVHLVDDRADLGNAIALNSLIVNTARVIGPALAGMLLSLVGEAACFALNALSFVVVLGAVWTLRDLPAATSSAGWWAAWLEGAKYAFGFGPSRALLLLAAALAWTVSPYSSLMPVYAKDIYGGGPYTLGLLLSSAGLGALASMLYLANRPNVRGLGIVIARAALASGTALTLFAYLRIFPLALALMTIVGGGLILVAAGANTILQTIVEDRLRGRVAGFYTMMFLGVAPLGNLAAGALAGQFTTQATFAFNGVLCIAAALWFHRELPRLREMILPMYQKLKIGE